MALRRARDIERSAHLEVRALVVDRMDLVGIGEIARCLVDKQGFVFPAVPQCLDDIEEFGGALIAKGVLDIAVAAEIAGLLVHGRRHHIPRRPALADMVERGKHAGDIVGLAVGARGGGDEADMPGHAGKRRQQRQRFQAGIGVMGYAALYGIPDRDMVGDEDRIDPGALGRLDEIAVEVEVEHFAARRARMAPRHAMIALRIEEKRAEDHVVACHAGLLAELLQATVAMPRPAATISPER
ncbi:hypothetical protein X756_10660 [Mesorhizobium sp. LSHC412B00]|nr:hypothetical protein X756_10660 [Mesorhizobium sp. LSHC412B00]